VEGRTAIIVLTGEDLATVTINGTRFNKKHSLGPSDNAEDTWNVVETDVFDVRSELGPHQRASTSSIEEDR
jgi:hypothetical protein